MAASAGVGFPDGAGAANLDVSWIHGSEAAKYNTDPDIQVHAYDEHTYILRQNMAVHYEAPFMFLLFGGSRALLLDTGATSNPAVLPAAPHRGRDHRRLAGQPPASRRTTGCSSSTRTRTPTTPPLTASSRTGPTP